MSTAALGHRLVKIEESIKNLQKEWDLFFGGQRKLPPTADQKSLEREFRVLRNTYIASSVLRFKMFNLHSRFNIYAEMWGRRMRELEEGPIHFKRRKKVFDTMQKKEKSAESDEPMPGNGKGPVVIHDPKRETGDMEKLYKTYVRKTEVVTRKKSRMTLALFTEKVGQQIETIERKRGCGAVEVSLAEEGGKVRLKIKAHKEKT